MFKTNLLDLKVDQVYAITIKDHEDHNQVDYVVVSRVSEITKGIIHFADFEELYAHDKAVQEIVWILNTNTLEPAMVADYFFIKMGHKDNFPEYLL